MGLPSIHQEEESFSRLASYKHHDIQLRINYPHFAWPAWRIVFNSNKVNSFKANQLIPDPPCDSHQTCQESKRRGLLQVVKRKNFCPGVCALGRAAFANRHIGASERRPLIPHVRFQVPF